MNRSEVLREPQLFPHLPTPSSLPGGNFLSAQTARQRMETGQSAHPLLGGNAGLSLYEQALASWVFAVSDEVEVLSI